MKDSKKLWSVEIFNNKNKKWYPLQESKGNEDYSRGYYYGITAIKKDNFSIRLVNPEGKVVLFYRDQKSI